MQINTRKHGPERIKLTKRERQTLNDAVRVLQDIALNADNSHLTESAGNAGRMIDETIATMREVVPAV